MLADLFGTWLRTTVDPEQVRCLTGETAGARALVVAARRMREDLGLDACLVAAADSWLTTDALRWLALRCPIRREVGDEGLAPSEAGAAVWLVRSPYMAAVELVGTGAAATGGRPSNDPLGRAVGRALAEARREIQDVQHIVLDTGTDVWGSVSWSATVSRASIRPWIGTTWLPAESIGHVGAAAGIIEVMLASHVLTRHGEGGAALCITAAQEHGQVAVVLAALPDAAVSLEEPIPWAL